MNILIDFVNGVLVQIYFLSDHWTVFVCLLAGILHMRAVPGESRVQFGIFALLTTLAAIIVQIVDSIPLMPLSYILAGLSLLVLLFVAVERDASETLRYRAVAEVAIYAGIVLLFVGFDFVILHELGVAAWTGAILGNDEFVQEVNIIRHMLLTQAVWGLWTILPGRIVWMLLQKVVIHRPDNLKVALDGQIGS
ncbi:MAG: hypothetical protein OXG36_11025 [Caldilineaceae bacterium]|nr:hypothetical protein [Caldilineaceae bacterium]